jgi:hypothetical protein
VNACLQSLDVYSNEIGAEGAKGLGDALKVVDDVCM